MYKIETRNKPRSRLAREASMHCVRVYRDSPTDLILQIWDGRRYMLVALAPQEARDIASELVATAESIETRQKESTHA